MYLAATEEPAFENAKKLVMTLLRDIKIMYREWILGGGAPMAPLSLGGSLGGHFDNNRVNRGGFRGRGRGRGGW